MNTVKFCTYIILIGVVLVSSSSRAMNSEPTHAKKGVLSWFKPKKRKEKSAPLLVTPIGILNSGNSCYANSVMQLLMLMDDQFWSTGRTQFLPTDAGLPLSKEQRFLTRVFAFRDTWVSGRATPQTNKSKLRHIIDSGIRNGIYIWPERFGQEDATEFFQGIAQFLGDTTYNTFTLQSTIQFFHEGQLRQETTFEIIPSGIELAIPRLSESSKAMAFSDLFAAYFAGDDLTGDNQYAFDGNKYDAVKFLRLAGNADYLFVSLKRFYIDQKNTRRKIITKVDFGDGEISLGDAIVNGEPLGDTFVVAGISMHSGTAHGGHYTARVNYGNTWYTVDDGAVKATSWQEVKDSAQTQAYLLLLKRKK